MTSYGEDKLPAPSILRLTLNRDHLIRCPCPCRYLVKPTQANATTRTMSISSRLPLQQSVIGLMVDSLNFQVVSFNPFGTLLGSDRQLSRLVSF